MKFGEMDPMHVPTDRQRGITDPWQGESDGASGPYIVSRADPSGTEAALLELPRLDKALRIRDILREDTNPRSVHYRVTDADDPERGGLEWDDDA